MADQQPENWEIFEVYYPQFLKVQRELAKNDWYRDDGWTMFIGYYHAGIYLQLYKPNWHNYTLDGVHIEIGLDADSLQSRKLRIDLHIGHRNVFDREQFNDLTVEAMYETVTAWQDAEVTFSKTNLSQRVSLVVPFTKTGFTTQVADNLAMVATTLGPIIDEGLASLT